MDRQLGQALSHGPDALRTAGVLGIGERVTTRHAAADAKRAA